MNVKQRQEREELMRAGIADKLATVREIVNATESLLQRRPASEHRQHQAAAYVEISKLLNGECTCSR